MYILEPLVGVAVFEKEREGEKNESTNAVLQCSSLLYTNTSI